MGASTTFSSTSLSSAALATATSAATDYSSASSTTFNLDGYTNESLRERFARMCVESSGPSNQFTACAESSIGGETTCLVCMEKPKTHMAVPCGHLCVCSTCAQQLPLCPYCNTDTTQWIKPRFM